MSLIVLPRQLVVDINGTPRNGARVYLYDANTSTPRPAYPTAADAAAATNPLTQPVASLSTGLFPAMWVATAGGDYKIIVKDSADVTLYTEDYIPPAYTQSSDILALILDRSDDTPILNSLRRTPAEIAAGVMPTDYAYPPGDIRRYGAVEGAVNNVAIQRACDSATAGDTVRLTVGGLIIFPVIITTDDIEIDGCGRVQQFSPSYTRDIVGPGNWTPYNQMFVTNADRVFYRRLKCHGGIIAATSHYFSGSFIWFAANIAGGGVEYCYFQNLRYDSSNSVAIQTTSTSSDIKIVRNKFFNCTGSVSLQGFYSICDNNTTEITDAMGAAPLTDALGVTDQPYGTDGSTGCSLINNKIYRTSGAPVSGAIIGANSGSTKFTIANNTIYGLTGGVALYVRQSSNGTVANNIIDGAGFAATALWAFLRVDADSSGVDVSNNTLTNPLTTISNGLAIDVSTGNNIIQGNKVLFGSSGTASSCVQVVKATTPGTLQITGNTFQMGGAGINFNISDNIDAVTGFEIPIRCSNNTYASPLTVLYSAPGVSRQMKLYFESENVISNAYNPAAVTLTPKLNRMFRVGLAANFAYRIGVNIDIHSTEVPSGANYYLATYETGDIIYHSQTVAGGSEGWKCTTGGTIPDGTPYSQAGTSTSGSPIITALANTTLVLVGDYVSPSAGFATTGPFKVIAKTSTTLTLNVNSNANASPTVTHFAPVFKTLAVVAA